MSSQKPIFFLVHGAFAGSFVFAPTITQLWSKDYSCWCQELPFHKGDPNVGVEETLSFVQTEIVKLCEQGHDVIPVCWSFGGVIAPGAFEGLFKSDREKKGEKGGIVGMVWAASPIVPKAGMTATENSEHWDGQTWFLGAAPEILDLGPTVGIKPCDKAAEIFYNTMPTSMSPRELFDPLLSRAAWKAHSEPIPYIPEVKADTADLASAGTFPVPVGYILTEKDNAIPTAVQEKVVKKYEGKMKVYRVDAGHLLWVDAAEEAANDLVDFAKSIAP